MSINKQLKIGDLTAKLPIIQGGMGVGVSRSSLAGAVAKEGGVGIISTAQIGYDEEGFEKDQAACNNRAIHKHIKRAKELCAGKWSCRCKYYGCTEALCGACERGRGSRCRCDHQWCRTSDEPSGAGQRDLQNEDRANRFF